MTTRINLLPHREERRKRARQHFAVMAGVAAAIGVAIVVAVHLFYAERIANQTSRNETIKRETARLDKEIDEIKALKDEIAQLLARKQAIETLQGDRAQTVYLLDQLVRQMPEGVYLKSVRQKGMGVNITGYAQSNARVSTLMRNIESSQWLAAPGLIEIRADLVDKKRVSAFNLNFALKRPSAAKPEAKAPAGDAGKAPAKDAAKDAAKKG
jgi:type IV pilus assembly protein PilN